MFNPIARGRIAPGVPRGVLASALVVGMAVTAVASQTPAGRGGATTPSSTPPSATGLIVGRVVDATTRQPVTDAIVTLNGGSLSAPAALSPAARAASARKVMTEANGRFVFRDLGRGDYTISATKPGYVAGSYGLLRPRGLNTPLALGDDERVIDADITLWKFGAIGGSVLDEADEPMVEVPVRVLRRTTLSGRPGFSEAGSATTDDRGMYRVASLIPGDYVVLLPSTATTIPAALLDEYFRASGDRRADLQLEMSGAMSSMSAPGSAGNQQIGGMILQVQGRSPQPPRPGDSGTLAVYPATFYPQAAAVGQASVVTIAAGATQSNIDFHLRPQPAVRVSGRLESPIGPVGNTAVLLLRSDDATVSVSVGFEVATTISEANGAFTFLGVPPGRYQIRVTKLPRPAASSTVQATVIQTPTGTASRGVGAPMPGAPTEPTLWAAQSVTVGGTDVDDLVVPLHAGARVTGRVVFEGDTPPAAFASRVALFLESSNSRTTAMVPETIVDANGAFATYQVPAGRYRLTVPTPAGWTVKSAIAGDRDLADLPFEIGDADLSGVVVTITNQLSQVAGVVRTQTSTAAAAADVIVFPTDPRQWVDFSSYSRHIREARPDKAGAFAIDGLPPGEYFIVAVPAAAMDWSRPQFFETLSRGATRFHLAAAEHARLFLGSGLVF